MARHFVEENTEWLQGDASPLSSYPVTMACWFRTDNVTFNDRCLIQIADSGQSDRYFRLGLSGTNNEITALTRFDEVANGILTTTSYSANTWHHGLMSGSKSGNDVTQSVYLDAGGEGDETLLSRNDAIGLNEIAIGYENDSSPGDPWDGDIGEAAVWNVVLTDEERVALAAGMCPLFVRSDALVFYVPLNAPSGDEIDLIGGIVLSDINTVTASPDHPPIHVPETDIWVPPSVPASIFQPIYPKRDNVLLRM